MNAAEVNSITLGQRVVPSSAVLEYCSFFEKLRRGEFTLEMILCHPIEGISHICGDRYSSNKKPESFPAEDDPIYGIRKTNPSRNSKPKRLKKEPV